jgi:hypothetical protein
MFEHSAGPEIPPSARSDKPPSRILKRRKPACREVAQLRKELAAFLCSGLASGNADIVADRVRLLFRRADKHFGKRASDSLSIHARPARIFSIFDLR